MSASGHINVEFMKHVIYGEVFNAPPKVAVYKRDPTTGALVKYKDLPTMCNLADVYNGVGIECTGGDISQDEYTADAFAIVRTPFTVDGVTSEVVMIHYATVSKTRDQRLDVDLRVEITGG